MTSMTDKCPVKDFNAIFKDDHLAKELSQLIEKSNNPKKFDNEIRYTKEELLEIGKNPICKIPTAIFNARLAETNLNENIIYSLQRKSSLEKSQIISSSQENISDAYDEVAPTYTRYKNTNNRNTKIRETGEVYRENPTNSRYEREKPYRPNKMSESESAQCWRTDKNIINSNNNNNRPKREYQDKPYNLYSQSRKPPYSKYNRNGYHDTYEEEPEWFSNGPESMNDFVDLKGFDDDDDSIGSNHEYSEKHKSKNLSNSGDLSKNESFNPNLSDISSMLNLNTSEMFNSPNVSFLGNKDFNDFPLTMFGDMNSSNSSSRAEKWFKRKSSSGDDSRNQTNGSKSSGPEQSNLIMENLFQNAKKFSQPSTNIGGIKVDMSKATNLADLEANLLNTAPTKKKNENDFSNDTVLSKLLSLAESQQEARSQSQNIQQSNAFPRPTVPSTVNVGNESFKRPPFEQKLIHERPNVPMFAPNEFAQMQNIQNMNRMMHPNFFKGAPPPPAAPFPFHENAPFNMENMNQRPPFFPPVPPELAHQFVPNPNFVPSMMPHHFPQMINPQGLPPNLAAQFLSQYQSAMRQASVMPQDLHARSKNEESNQLADKMLKNSKFTPTSVFRKINDQNKSKTSKTEQQHLSLHEQSQMNLLNSNSRSSDPFDFRALSNNHAQIHAANMAHQRINDKNPDMALLLERLNLNRAPPQQTFSDSKPNAVSFNANDIFNVMQNGERPAANVGHLPPLPMKNALTLEDIEKM